MSFLRRRRGGADDEVSTSSSQSPSREPTPSILDPSNPTAQDYKVVKKRHLDKIIAKTKGRKRRTAWIFGLGGLFGIMVALFFAGNHDIIDLSMFTDMNLEGLMDVLPSGLLRDARELQKHEREAVNYDSFAVGLHARSQGIRANHPVIMIPGVISTGLESWGTSEGSRPYFRKRLWGSWTMMRALVMDKSGWKRHIMLDMETGLDPPNIKLRASQGFDATDFFITGYWIWNKILENLATIGYDPTNAFTAAYDWRLAYVDLERRDQYFTRLKTHIETAVKTQGKKVVLLSHSMGSQVVYYFLHWVEASGHGDGGTNWVETHVDSWINISGCMLGAVKGLTALLSGEMRDTAQLNAFAVYGLEKFLSRAERAEIFRAMPGISSMLPIGGNTVWGNETWAPDDAPGQKRSFGAFLSFRPPLQSNSNGNGSPDPNSTPQIQPQSSPLLDTPPNITVSNSLAYLFSQTDPLFHAKILSSYSHGVAHTRKAVEVNQRIPSKWINPLETRLPLAPSLKIYCFYGVGKATERAYFYRQEPDIGGSTSSGSGEGSDKRLNVTIDTGYTDAETGADHGVVMGEGDGTVNLLSSGYMCAKGWKMKRYNPAGVKIKVFEMPHEPDRFSPRGGPNTGDHVDILGRSSLNDLILRVAGGKGDLIEDTIHSNIMEYAEKVPIYDDE